MILNNSYSLGLGVGGVGIKWFDRQSDVWLPVFDSDMTQKFGEKMYQRAPNTTDLPSWNPETS